MKEENFNIAKLIFSAVGSFAIKQLGGESALLDFLLILIASDFVMGTLKAVKTKNFNSSIVRWGAVNKALEIVIVVILNYCDRALKIDIFRNAGLVWFSVCEGTSILENLIILGMPVPEGLKEVFSKLRSGVSINFVKICEEIISKAQEDIEHTTTTDRKDDDKNG